MTDNQDKTAPDPNKVDAMKLSLMLTDLRLPTISQLWQSFAKRADKEGWTASRFLAALAEHELAERDRRRIERHLREARLLPGKTLDSFDFNVVPMISRAQVNALAAGDAWLNQGANCLIFGPPGAGKSHLASAIGLALVENGYRVLFTRTTDLVQRMQVARRELALEALLARLDRFNLLILDDLAYVRKDQAETGVLFELISARYERRSLLIYVTWNMVAGGLFHALSTARVPQSHAVRWTKGGKARWQKRRHVGSGRRWRHSGVRFAGSGSRR